MGSRAARWCALVTIAALYLSAPRIARADDDAPTGEGSEAAAEQGSKGGGDAARFFEAADRAYREGRYVDAARAFEEAARIKPHPAPVINAADAWEKAGEYAMAARAFQRVLDMKNASEQDRVDAVDRLARLRPRLGIIELVGDETMRARVDDEEFHGGQRVYVFPGEHSVALVDVDGSKTRALDIKAGTVRSVRLDALAPSVKPGGGSGGSASGSAGVDVGTTGGGGIRPPTIVAYSVAALGLAGTIYFGLQVNSAESDYDANPNQDDFDRFEQNKMLTNISLGLGVVAAGVGTFLLVQDLGRDSGGAASSANRGQRSLGVRPVSSGAVLLGSTSF